MKNFSKILKIPEKGRREIKQKDERAKVNTFFSARRLLMVFNCLVQMSEQNVLNSMKDSISSDRLGIPRLMILSHTKDTRAHSMKLAADRKVSMASQNFILYILREILRQHGSPIQAQNISERDISKLRLICKADWEMVIRFCAQLKFDIQPYENYINQ